MAYHVLIVDDEEDVAAALSFILEPEWRVTMCCDAAIAVDRIKKDTYDLIITDLRMPTTSGLEVLKAAQSVTPPVPVVISTGFSPDDAQVKNLIAYGASATIHKPFIDVNKIRQKLARIVLDAKSQRL